MPGGVDVIYAKFNEPALVIEVFKIKTSPLFYLSLAFMPDHVLRLFYRLTRAEQQRIQQGRAQKTRRNHREKGRC